MNEFGPLYQDGHLSIENAAVVAAMDQANCQVGVQMSSDGRLWVCVNGVAFIRFKPATPPKHYVPEGYVAIEGPYGWGVAREAKK